MKIFVRLKYLIGKLIQRITFSPGKYWDERSKEFGARAVFHLGHAEDELTNITEFQIKTLFPFLKKELKGDEQTILDFGCGSGRFTGKLAELINGKALGVDITGHLLDIAPLDKNVEYKQIKNGIIPAPDNSFDVVWVCIVFGSIVTSNNLKQTINELQRVSKKNGIIFIVENTAEKKSTLSFKYRSISEYEKLFKNFHLKHISDYTDIEERISIFCGVNG